MRFGTIFARLKNNQFESMKFRYLFVTLTAVLALASCVKDEKKEPAEFKGEISEERAVDMGTGVLWSGVNLGAGKAEQVGAFYAWAEPVKDTTAFSLDTYTHYSTTLSTYLKYNAGDKLVSLQQDDDPAAHFWGPEYRTPSRDDFEKLASACDWTYAKLRGVIGWVATSKTTGNSIFFPLCGYRSGNTMKREGSLGVYWTSELTSTDAEASGTNEANVNLSWSFGLTSASMVLGYADRFVGANVRPVSTQ